MTSPGFMPALSAGDSVMTSRTEGAAPVNDGLIPSTTFGSSTYPMLLNSRTHRSRFASSEGVPERLLLVALQRIGCMSWLTRVVDGVTHPATRTATTSGDRMVETSVRR